MLGSRVGHEHSAWPCSLAALCRQPSLVHCSAEQCSPPASFQKQLWSPCHLIPPASIPPKYPRSIADTAEASLPAVLKGSRAGSHTGQQGDGVGNGFGWQSSVGCSPVSHLASTAATWQPLLQQPTCRGSEQSCSRRLLWHTRAAILHQNQP